MRANVLLRWLVPALLLTVVLFIVKGWLAGSSSETSSAESFTEESLELSAEEAEALGVAGDTPRDTVATLVGQVKAMRSEMLGLKKNNESLQQDNSRLREREKNVDSRIAAALNGVNQQTSKERQQAESARAASEQERKQTRSLLDQMNDRIAKLKGGADLPVGLGLEPGDGAQFGSQGTDPDAVTWIEPADQLPTQSSVSKSNGPSSFQKLGALAESASDTSQKTRYDKQTGSKRTQADRQDDARPVYTIAQNSTLMGSVAITALIGRVPVDGTVNDPFPFKVLIGPDNLAANGLDLPEVESAVISGSASGDWTLSCVRGHVESITFVFADGTVRTVPEPQAATRRQSNASSTSDTDNIRGGLGYISDPYGIPCIAGERKSNAQQYLGTQSLITAAGAGVAALLGDGQSSTSVVGSGGSVGVTQNAGNTALNTILSSGVDDLGGWVKKLYGEAFAAIYVQPAAQVAVHLDQEIAIDYEPNGRRVRHESHAAHTLDLD